MTVKWTDEHQEEIMKLRAMKTRITRITDIMNMKYELGLSVKAVKDRIYLIEGRRKDRVSKFSNPYSQLQKETT